MLINLRGTKDSDGVLKFNMPKTNLDERFNYKIGITHLNFKLDGSRSDVENNELISVVSNLVDLTMNNKYQTIAYFSFNSEFDIQNFQPSIVYYQPLQLYELENASFELYRCFVDKALDLKYLFIQLEILRLDAYGRLQ